MTIAVETYLVVALAFAVFSAVIALGSSLVLGIGFERLRAGFETVKNQTGFFSDSIHNLDQRVDSLQKQSKYQFETLHKLEEEIKTLGHDTQDEGPGIAEIAGVSTSLSADKYETEHSGLNVQNFWSTENQSAEQIRFN